MKLSIQSVSAIESAVTKALSRYKECGQQTITDIHFMPKADSGELAILNDDDEELGQLVVAEWADNVNGDWQDDVERYLRQALVNLQNSGSFDSLNLLKPYSFVLVDEDHETIAELLLVDDDTLLVNEELLEGLDQELDDFLKKLLEE